MYWESDSPSLIYIKGVGVVEAALTAPPRAITKGIDLIQIKWNTAALCQHYGGYDSGLIASTASENKEAMPCVASSLG